MNPNKKESKQAWIARGNRPPGYVCQVIASWDGRELPTFVGDAVGSTVTVLVQQSFRDDIQVIPAQIKIPQVLQSSQRQAQ